MERVELRVFQQSSWGAALTRPYLAHAITPDWNVQVSTVFPVVSKETMDHPPPAVGVIVENPKRLNDVPCVTDALPRTKPEMDTDGLAPRLSPLLPITNCGARAGKNE